MRSVAKAAASEKPHERLNRAMDQRRLTLGLDWEQVATRAGITSAALRAIRRGKNRGRDLTRRKLDDALQWEPGTLDGLADGRIGPDEVRESERSPSDDDMPLTRGEFRLYLALCQDPDATLSDAAMNKLRALGIDPARLRTTKRGTR